MGSNPSYKNRLTNYFYIHSESKYYSTLSNYLLYGSEVCSTVWNEFLARNSGGKLKNSINHFSGSMARLFEL